MGKETGISWCDHTFNPWWGCTKVSPGCDHCYAETFDKRTGGAHWGKGAPRREFGDAHWRQPEQWNQDAYHDGVRRRVFCASMADVMDDEAPEGARERLWKLIDHTPWLVWLLLTKRPHRYSRYLPIDGFAHDNVQLGATAENQEYFDLRNPRLEDAAAELTVRDRVGGWPRTSARPRVRTFISYEPALGAITMKDHVMLPDQVIFGGETGGQRRPMEQAWAETMLAECRERGVAFFMKQMSAGTPKAAAELIPPELLVREYAEKGR